MSKDLQRAKLLLEGAKITKVELGEDEAGGVVITLDTGVVLYAGARDPHDEDGAVNGYAAVGLQHSRGFHTVGTQGGE
jgi:hypothetical protein